MAFYGVGLEVKVRELNLQFKLLIQQKGGNGVRGLKQIFKKADYNGSGKLDIAEFEQALAQFGYVEISMSFRNQSLLNSKLTFHIDFSQRR